MEQRELIKLSISEHINVLNSLNEDDIKSLERIACLISKKLTNGNKIIWCGNGGSASDCQHLSSEFVGIYKKNRKALSSISLTTDTSALTCISNDFSYENIFSRQLEALGNKGDVLVAISTSGNSKNILSVLKTAKEMDIVSVGLLGKNGGKAKHLCDLSFFVPSCTTARIQEVHILIGHIICEIIELDYET